MKDGTPILLAPGARHPSWPWWMRSGCFVHFNFPDAPTSPPDRIAGVIVGGARDGQPAFVSVEDYPPPTDRPMTIKVRHPRLCAPCHPDNFDRYAAAARALRIAPTEDSHA